MILRTDCGHMIEGLRVAPALLQALSVITDGLLLDFKSLGM